MTAPKDPKEELAALMDACAESTEAMTDDELLQDAAAAGVDANAESSRIRGLLLSAFVRAKKVELAEAARQHQTAGTPSRRRPRLPSGASERRAMLMQELERRPQLKDAVSTLQPRDLPSFSDAEVESVLEQLGELGLLGDDDSK